MSQRPTFKRLSPGEFLISIPAGYDGLFLPDEIAVLMVLDDLANDPAGSEPVEPNRGRTVVPEPSREERQRQRDARRLQELMRQATSQRHLNALCDNEGLERVQWIEQGQHARSLKRRLAEQRDALHIKKRKS
jgi:hypothetical protein